MSWMTTRYWQWLLALVAAAYGLVTACKLIFIPVGYASDAVVDSHDATPVSSQTTHSTLVSELHVPLDVAEPIDRKINQTDAHTLAPSFFQSLKSLRLKTTKVSISQLESPSFSCHVDDLRDHCIFENICIQNPGYKRGTWFTTEELKAYSDRPIRLRHKGKELYTLDVTTHEVQDLNINYIQDDGMSILFLGRILQDTCI